MSSDEWTIPFVSIIGDAYMLLSDYTKKLCTTLLSTITTY